MEQVTRMIRNSIEILKLEDKSRKMQYMTLLSIISECLTSIYYRKY